MPRSFNFKFDIDWQTLSRDPKKAVRLVLGTLLGLNLIAAWFVFQTPGGSLEDLEREIVSKRHELVNRQATIQRLQKIVDKCEIAQREGDSFLTSYFLDRPTSSSMLESELDSAAKAANIRPRDRSYSDEPIEGSDTLGIRTINANYEGTYADLIQFINQLDRSKRLLILDQLNAQPIQGTGALAINLKMNVFYREEPGL
jgi:hypothetical protein